MADMDGEIKRLQAERLKASQRDAFDRELYGEVDRSTYSTSVVEIEDGDDEDEPKRGR